MARTLLKTINCSNCNKALTDENFCPDCGQKNTTKNVEMGMLVRFNIFYKIPSSKIRTGYKRFFPSSLN